MDVIVGTAGHIDHGKTALVKALTGVDADRLPEEKERGITIDIGFAELDLDDVHIGFVDVPGHEKFVKNMLAGASGIDLVMLVIAADEGVMPQTKEHFEICRLLETKAGIIVITKSDLVDEDTLGLVALEVAEMVKDSFLEKAPIVTVSSKSGEGIERLKDVIRKTAREVPERKSEFVTRLPIDRVFTVKGFGAVVTGTLVSGEIVGAQGLELLPLQRKVRVRGMQTHGKAASDVHAGQRVAINLGGIDHDEISRGMVLVEESSLVPTQIIDAEIEVISDAKSPLRSRQRVRVHIGTVEALARVDVLSETAAIAPGEKDFVQLRLELPIVTVPEERFIIRQYSPQVTIAGGRVIENLASRHRRKDLADTRDKLHALLSGSSSENISILIGAAGDNGVSFSELIARSGIKGNVLETLVESHVRDGSALKADDILISPEAFQRLAIKLIGALEGFHDANPLAKGMPLATLKDGMFTGVNPSVFRAVIDSLVKSRTIETDKDFVRAAANKVELSPQESKLKTFFSNKFLASGLEVPKLDDVMKEGVALSGLKPDHARKIFQLLLDSKELLKISDEFYFRREAVAGLIQKVQVYVEGSSDRLIDVPRFKDIAGLSRKYAIPLLEYFDREKVTRRSGDKRVIL